MYLPRGTTLIETIMAVSIFAFVTSSLATLIVMGVHIVRDDEARLDAVALAQSQIEAVKNVPYDDIGTVNGVPSGLFEQTSTEVRNNRTYTIETDIRYIDDPYDGVLPVDTVNTDYKSVRVEVTWEGLYVKKPVVLLTTIAPNGIETNAGGGTLWIEAHHADATPVARATVQVSNTDVNPPINTTALTDANGRYILPGAPASVQSYHVELSKSGYAPTQTYTVDPVANPNPDPSDLTVTEQQVTTKSFIIDAHSDIQFHIVDRTTGTPITSLPLTLTGSKRIGTDLDGSDIPKYELVHTTNGTGDVAVNDIEYDTYAVTIDDTATGYDFAGSAPHLPYVLAPGFSELITIHVEPDAAETALITVTDEDGVPQVGALVHVVQLSAGIDRTEATNTAGQVFFSPLAVATFTVEITQPGFELYTGTIEVAGDEQQLVPLTPLATP